MDGLACEQSQHRVRTKRIANPCTYRIIIIGDASTFAAYTQDILGTSLSGAPDVVCGYFSPLTMPGIRYGEPGLAPPACAAGDLSYNADRYNVRPVDLPVDRFWPITSDDLQVCCGLCMQDASPTQSLLRSGRGSAPIPTTIAKTAPTSHLRSRCPHFRLAFPFRHFG